VEQPVVARVALLLFGSGLCALVYQVAWLRELRLIFGASTAASAAVLAVFMGGLGAGGLWLGKRAGTRARPLALYGDLELGVAISSAATPLLVSLARVAYSALGGTVALGLVGGTIVRLLLSALVLCVPTFLMGGTLPAAAQAVETEGDLGRRRLAVLYGANTLGAVAGCLLSTFALLEILGIQRMLWSACALNALIAMIARSMARRMEPRAIVAARPAQAPGASDGGARPREHLALFAAALVGFAFLLMELVWYRMLGPLLGGSSFTFGLILAVALFGIGLGGGAYALLAGRRTPTLLAFALTCGVEAACIALPYALGDRIAIWAALLRPLGSIGFAGQIAGWAAIASIVVLPAAFVSGVQFPLLLALLGRGDRDVGRQVGLAYAWNTAGAIVGSLAGGFGLMPLVTAPGCWRVVVVVLAGLGIGAVGVALRRGGARSGAIAPLSAAALALVLLSARGPTSAWRHGAIGAGRGPQSGTPNTLRNWSNALNRAIVWEAEGVESSVALDSEAGLAFVVNGKIDGNARSDAPTQVMSGLTGAILHPRAEKAMVIGLGTGSTAGWLASVPSVTQVDVAELEPAILHVAKACRPVNQAVLENPKVHLFLGDARELLLTTHERYDLIFSEPSNPYRAGISSLFTQDFYRATTARLAPGGLFLQWVQAYSVDAQTVRSVYATLASVFPVVETFVTQEADLLLVASLGPIDYDVGRLRARIQEPPFAEALAKVWRVSDLEGFFAHYGARTSLARALATLEGDALNTDDQTLVEFGFARGVGRKETLFRTGELRELARARGEDRPEGMSNGSLDWALVDERRISMLVAQEASPAQLPYRLPPASILRGQAEYAWNNGDFRAALGSWRGQAKDPGDPLELAVLAESLADAGDEAALPLFEKLRAWQPIEADAFLGRLRLRQGRIADATEALERAFVGYQRDPWPMPMALSHALKLPVEIAARDRVLGERLYEILKTPFAVSMLDEQRRNVATELALRLDFRRLCREVFAGYQRFPSWRRDFLTGRWKCYELHGDPRAAEARRDLAAFNAEEPLPFASGLEAPAGPP
jgi:spermidine synthase